MLVRLILPEWAKKEYPERSKIIEGDYSDDELVAFNAQFYNVHYLPNYPSEYTPGLTVDGAQIDTFEYVFVDMDLKDGTYASKEDFIEVVLTAGLDPSRIIDSGNGVHVYWRVSDLDAMSYLKLQRRLMRKFKTDEAVAKIFQLMRPPGYVNTKHKDAFQMCEELYSTDAVYTCEALDAFLPPLTHKDEDYCKNHFAQTYDLKQGIEIDDTIPPKFHALIRKSQEAKDAFLGNTDDRSKADYRLGHIMCLDGFTKAEAMSVLVNSPKAISRSPAHRIKYAENIVSKIWTYEEAEVKDDLDLSSTVKEILSRSPGETLKGIRFPCFRYLDATHHGFRLGQVIGLVAGSGVGKTAMALNMFMGFVEGNPDYDHFFVPLEQPANEIADRWRTMCGERTHLHDKVHVISNYDQNGAFRHLSLDDIKEYILKFQKKTGKKVGAVVIDHVGALKKKGKNGENQDLMDICHQMKAFAVKTNTMMVMQSQAPREKAGIGDLELNKDAAYGTVYFESYCDYLITIWQPLKRCYAQEGCPTVTAFKFCKIRHKKKHLDEIQEDVRYRLYFDSATEHMRELTQDEEKSFDYFNGVATSNRKQDRKTDVLEYESMPWSKDGKVDNNQDVKRTSGTKELLN